MVGGCLVFIKVRPKILRKENSAVGDGSRRAFPYANLFEILCEFQEHDLLRVIVGWLELIVHNGLDNAGLPLWFADIVRLVGDLRDGIRFNVFECQWSLTLTL